MSITLPRRPRAVRTVLALVTAAALATVLAACSGSGTGSGGPGGAASGSADTRTITHELGTTRISGHPERVVALEYSFVQALDSIGTEPVGIADDNDPKRIDQLLGKHIDYTSVGTRLEPNLELIAGLKPDLIIADSTRHASIYGQLQKIAPTVVLNSWNGSYDEIKTSVVTIADALGDTAAGEQAVTAHEKKLAVLKAQIPAGDSRRYLLAVATADDMSLHTSSAFTGSVFQALGLDPAIHDDKTTIESGVGIERLVAVDPDVLFVAVDGSGTALESWEKNPAWQQISAVKNHQVFTVDRNQYSRFRGLQTAETIAQDVVDDINGATQR